MRLPSEQQLDRDCLTGVGECNRLDGDNSPSLESLMTLLWAIKVFEKNREHASKLDTATEGRQDRGRLDKLFRHIEVKHGHARDFFSNVGEGKLGQKSLDGWSPALDDRRS